MYPSLQQRRLCIPSLACVLAACAEVELGDRKAYLISVLAGADEAGNPRLAEAITFPASVILAPGAYFFHRRRSRSERPARFAVQLRCSRGDLVPAGGLGHRQERRHHFRLRRRRNASGPHRLPRAGSRGGPDLVSHPRRRRRLYALHAHTGCRKPARPMIFVRRLSPCSRSTGLCSPYPLARLYSKKSSSTQGLLAAARSRVRQQRLRRHLPLPGAEAKAPLGRCRCAGWG